MMYAYKCTHTRVLIYSGEDVRRVTDDGDDVCRQCVRVCKQ